MRRLRSLFVFGVLAGLGVVGCQTPTNEVAPEPPVRKTDGGGLLLNNGGMQLGPGAGGRSGYRVIGDGEWGF